MRAAFASLVSVVVIALAACSTGTGGPDVDGGAGADGGGGTGGPATAVDVGCIADGDCEAGAVCDVPTGNCVAGFDCAANPSVCAFCGDDAVNGDVDCGFGAAVAFCDEAAGVCRRAKGECALCIEDSECAPADNGLQSKCIDGFCAVGCGACPAGFQCTDGGCVPAANAGTCDGAVLCGDGTTCPDGTLCSELNVCLAICESDDDCEAGKFCWLESGPLQQQCIEKCPVGTLNGQGLVCHADGRFGAPCTTPDATTGCPLGTVCDDDGVCILTGCQSDANCPLVRTYCDLATSTCVEGCNDATDCGAFEECIDDQCVRGGCRSKDSSCNLGQFCCGADLYETEACPAGVEDGACFIAQDPFCRPCEDDDDCADLPSSCYELKRTNEAGEDESIGKFCAAPCSSNSECPRGVQCRPDLPTSEEGVTASGCLDALCAGIANAQQ